jgi:V/A-type H+-transporting ATPase subunit E
MSSSSSADTGTGGEAQSDANVGVQELIDRLKTEGVQEGQQQAEALLAEAKKQAAKIVDAARAEADAIAKAAQQQAERTQTNGERALALASRDTSLQLKEQLQHEFRGWVGGLVREQLDEPEFLAELIRELAAQAMATIDNGTGAQDSQQGGKLRFLVGEDGAKSLEAFVKGQAAEMLRQGVCLQADRSLRHGFRVQIVGDDIEINFSDEAVTAALMRFLAPKFRQRIGSVSGDA